MFPGSVMSNKQGKTYEEIYGSIKAEKIRGKKSGGNHPLAGKTYNECYGENRAKEIKQIQREAQLGRNRGEAHPLYGKTYEEYFGEEKAREIKQKQGKSGESNPSKRLEVREKIRDAKLENNWMRGRTPEIKGKTYEEYYGEEKAREIKQKLCGANLGENSPNWQGGVSNFPYAFEFNNEFKILIRERDNNICQLCGKTKEEEGRNLAIHHINHDKMNNCTNEFDFITLCCSCNSKVNTNKEYWTKFFQQKIELRFCVVN